MLATSVPAVRLLVVILATGAFIAQAQMPGGGGFSFAIVNRPRIANDLERIVYGNGTFVAIGNGGVVLTSPEGVNWSLHAPTTNGAPADAVTGLVYGNSNFVAVSNSGSDGQVQFSPDGVTWGSMTVISSVAFNAVNYAKGTYVAVGQSGGSSVVVSSTNGIDWITRGLPSYGPLNAVVFGNGTFVAVGDAGTIVASTNGFDWTPQTVAPGTNILCVSYGNGYFLAAGDGGIPSSILKSSNGLIWQVYNPQAARGNRMTYGSGHFVLQNYGNSIATSTDGLNWAYIWTHGGALLSISDLAYGAGSFVVVGPDDLIWTFSPSVALSSARRVSANFSLTVTGGGAGQPYRVQAATNLLATNWVSLLSLTNQGFPTNFVDTGASNYPQRFYRVVSP